MRENAQKVRAKKNIIKPIQTSSCKWDLSGCSAFATEYQKIKPYHLCFFHAQVLLPMLNEAVTL